MKQLYDYKENNSIDLDRIVDDFTPYIKTVIKNMAGNYLGYEDKEEILVDTFFVLWKNQDKNITYLEAYLAGIARNLVKEKIKKDKITYNIDDYENVINYYDNIELFSEKREKLSNLKIGYKALTEDEFKIISMFYYSSKSVKDIAKELNFSEANIKTKLFRIRKKLKKYLM
jgi:RNA polymerase sigma-70 factor (ECF subfamily)